MWVALLIKYGQDFDYFLFQIFEQVFLPSKRKRKQMRLLIKWACLELASQGARGDSVDQM